MKQQVHFVSMREKIAKLELMQDLCEHTTQLYVSHPLPVFLGFVLYMIVMHLDLQSNVVAVGFSQNTDAQLSSANHHK